MDYKTLAKQLEGLWKQFVDVGYDEKGILNKFKPKLKDNFNFAYDIIEAYAKIAPDARFLEWASEKGEQRTFTFKEMSELSNKAANLFISNGIKKGDMVMLVLKRNWQFWVSFYALMKIGAVAIPATHMLTPHDFEYRIEKATIVSAIVTADNPEVAKYLEEGDQKTNSVKTRFLANLSASRNSDKTLNDGFLDFDKLLENQSPEFERIETNNKEKMLLYFTSGTSGYPKMVIHNHRYPVWHFQTAIWHNCKCGGLHLTIADTGWGKAVWGKVFGQQAMGSASFVYDYDKFIPHDILSLFAKYKITTFCAPPTMYRFFIKEGLENYDLSSLEYITTAGEAVNDVVFTTFLEKTKMKIMEGFGQTETALCLGNLPGSTPKPGSMGKPVPLYEIALTDDNGKPVDTGEIGVISVKLGTPDTEGMFTEYYRDEEKTKACQVNGYYRTGDLAYADEDGYYWFVGRDDDIIKSSGYRIGPFEVESVIMTHPAVMEVAVTGVPDTVRGFAVKATIVLTKNYADDPNLNLDELTKEIQSHVKKNTAPYKYPRVVEFVKELPKTISGKIRRVEIREKK